MSDSDQNTVWIFHGEDALFASAVFTTEADALSWAARHRVSGIVTEYPVGNGGYDIAVERGSPSHVAAFSPGWTRHVHLVDGLPNEPLSADRRSTDGLSVGQSARMFGCDEGQLAGAEDLLGVRLPASLRSLYLAADGRFTRTGQ